MANKRVHNIIGAIWIHTYSAAVTTLSDSARTYSDYCGPRGGVAA